MRKPYMVRREDGRTDYVEPKPFDTEKDANDYAERTAKGAQIGVRYEVVKIGKGIIATYGRV